jgi:hypothetical protein
MTAPESYFTTLARELAAAGVPADRVTTTIADLESHLAETGTAPEAEFGPAADFAAQLAFANHPQATETAPEAAPDAAIATWRWMADIWADRQRLNEFGAQGWEVERVDRLGRFVTHRDPSQAQQWEYRRDTVARTDRTTHAAELAPDGWEPCGTWLPYVYYKRPLAADLGPAAVVPTPPPGPARKNFLSRRFYALLAALVAYLVLTFTTLPGLPIDGESLAGFFTGVASGILIVGTIAWLLLRHPTRR